MNLQRAVMMALMGMPASTPIANHASGFDPKLLLDATTTSANSTERVPVPAGEHLAVIEAVDIRSGNKDGKNWAFLDVTYNIDSPELKEKLGRQKIALTQGIGLDFTPDGRSLDNSKGRNVTLGRLRESTGLNVDGQPYAHRMLVGKPVKILVGHRPDSRPQARPGDVFENIDGFTKA